MHILITRPEPDASEWRAAFEAQGATVTVDPLLDIEFLPPSLTLDGIQALIATSRNGLRGLRGRADLASARRLPVFAVGPGTAALAVEMGFEIIHQGPAAARDLVPLIVRFGDPKAGRLLHVCGDKLAFDLGTALAPHGYKVDRLTVYRSRPALALQAQTRAALMSGAIDTVMLMSPLTARTFVKLAVEANFIEHCQRVVYVCLSNNVADALAPLGRVTTRIAAAPHSQAMFTLIESLVAETR